MTFTEEVIRLASFVIQLLFLIYMRDNISKLEAYYGERNICISNYAIVIKKMPAIKNIQEKLRNFFREEFIEKHEIKQITLLPEYWYIRRL